MGTVWLGLALGVYIAVLSLTGSAIVFRRELDVAFGPARPPIDKTQRILSPEELTAFARREYPDFAVERVGDVQRRTPVVQIGMRRGDEEIERVFNSRNNRDS